MNKNNEILEDKIWDPMNGNVPIKTMEDFQKYTEPFFCKPIVIANEMRTRENYLSTVTYLQNVLISCYEKEFVFRWSQILHLLRAALKTHGCDSFRQYGAAIPRFPPLRAVYRNFAAPPWAHAPYSQRHQAV